MHYVQCNRNGHESSTCHTPWEKIKEYREKQEQQGEQNKASASAHFIIVECNVGLSDLLNTSFTSWEDAWLLDTGASCHMTFQRGFFEELSFDIDGAVYFANRSQLKLSGIGSIWLRLPGYPDFLLHKVLYLLELRRNLLSLVLVRQQGHSIHIFNGKVEIRRSSWF